MSIGKIPYTTTASEIISLMLDMRDDKQREVLMHKAVGWMLREGRVDEL